MKDLWRWMALIALIAACIWASKWIFETVMASSLPLWAKWMLLR